MSTDYKREPAKRVLAAELDIADYHFKEEDDDRAPNYLLLPSGGRANRVMMCGTLLEVEDVGNEEPFWKAVINDGSSQFMAFAGRYDPEAAQQLQAISNDESMPPAYVAVVGKTREYRPEDDEGEVMINIRPKSITVIDESQRNNWKRETISHTLDRLEREDGNYVEQAEERYGDRVELFKDMLRKELEQLEE